MKKGLRSSCLAVLLLAWMTGTGLAGTGFAERQEKVDVVLKPVKIQERIGVPTTVIALPDHPSNVPELGDGAESGVAQPGVLPGSDVPELGDGAESGVAQPGILPGSDVPGSGNTPGTGVPDGGKTTGWFGQVWGEVTDFFGTVGRGILVGAIGAAVVIGLAAGVAALVGATIAVPVIAAGVAAGMAFGVGYSFLSGDGFHLGKGIAWGAIGAGFGLAAASAGAGAVMQSGFQFIRSGMNRLFTSPVGGWTSSLASKGTLWSFGTNMAWNSGVYFYDNGMWPASLEDWGRIALGSAVTALAFDKISRFLSVQPIKQAAKNVLHAIVGTVDAMVANYILPKREHQVGGYAAGIIGSLTYRAHWLGRLTDKARRKRKIGTTLDELRLTGIRLLTALPGRTFKAKATNRQIDNLHHASPEDFRKVVQYLRGQKGVITRNQMMRLKENQQKYNRYLWIEKSADAAGKVLDKTLDTAISKGLDKAGVHQPLNEFLFEQGQAEADKPVKGRQS
ncbi:MAG: hypothetical protein H0Z34_09490 [Brevibacillus sp.]|nr:hypothetical protein [Brevibacillus sp.]